jgi:thiol-disulfide isomerase/thioredoxin
MTPRRRNTLILIGVAAAAAGAGFLASPGILQRGPGETDALRAARFLDLDGKPRTLADWQGKILIVNFWATWCAPCLEEIPILVAVREVYASAGVEIVGIAVDLHSKIVEFSKKLSISYPLLIADAGGLDLMRQLGNTAGGLPYTVFLDRSAALVRRKLGALKRQEIEATLSQLLKK